MQNLLISVPVLFVISLVIVLIIVAFSRSIAPPNRENVDRNKAYACGEDMPCEQGQFYVHIFEYAVFFLIFDIVAFILATAAFNMGLLAGNLAAILPVVYILIVVFTIMVLFPGKIRT
ncbi:MAG: NADH-quinone oxidoreductase subunit A [Promethearchaeota archaeon]